MASAQQPRGLRYSAGTESDNAYSPPTPVNDDESEVLETQRLSVRLCVCVSCYIYRERREEEVIYEFACSSLRVFLFVCDGFHKCLFLLRLFVSFPYF